MNFFKRVRQAAKMAMDSSATASFFMKYNGKKLSLAEGGEAVVSYTKEITYNEAKSQCDDSAMSQIVDDVAYDLELDMETHDDAEESMYFIDSLTDRAKDELENGSRGDEEFLVYAKVSLVGSFKLLPDEEDQNALENAIKYGRFARSEKSMVFKAEVYQALESRHDGSGVYVEIYTPSSVKIEN